MENDPIYSLIAAHHDLPLRIIGAVVLLLIVIATKRRRSKSPVSLPIIANQQTGLYHDRSCKFGRYTGRANRAEYDFDLFAQADGFSPK
jgi:hypothetical protein